MSLANPTIPSLIRPFTQSLMGYYLVSYEQPNVELFMQNYTNQTKTVCIGGAIAQEDLVQNFANVFTNPNFEQGATGWSVGGGWVVGVGSAVYTVPVVPDTSSTIGQTISGLTVGREYRIKVRVNFSAPFTGTLQVYAPLLNIPLVGVVGEYEYDGVVVCTNSILQFFGVEFQVALPTAIGTTVTLLGIDVLDNNNPNTRYYEFFNNYTVSRPVRMTNTRLLFQNASQLLLPMRYVRDSITGDTKQDAIPIQNFINPYYTTAWNVLDMKDLVYTLDGMQYIEFVLPPLSYAVWSADVQAEVRPIGA